MTRVFVRPMDPERRSLIWDCEEARTDDLGRVVMGLARQIAGDAGSRVRESTAVVYVPMPGDVIEFVETEDS